MTVLKWSVYWSPHTSQRVVYWRHIVLLDIAITYVTQRRLREEICQTNKHCLLQINLTIDSLICSIFFDVPITCISFIDLTGILCWARDLLTLTHRQLTLTHRQLQSPVSPNLIQFIKSYVDVYCRYPPAKYEGVVCSFQSWCVERSISQHVGVEDAVTKKPGLRSRS